MGNDNPVPCPCGREPRTSGDRTGIYCRDLEHNFGAFGGNLDEAVSRWNALMSPPARPAFPSCAPQSDVLEFHRALDIPIGPFPGLHRWDLRASLIEEEAAETLEAIRGGDLLGTIDGLCDLIYVCYGAAIEFGVNLTPFWNEVHRSNMAKVGGAVREDGKRMKPPGWTPPDLASVLRSGAGDLSLAAVSAAAPPVAGAVEIPDHICPNCGGCIDTDHGPDFPSEKCSGRTCGCKPSARTHARVAGPTVPPREGEGDKS